MLTLVGLMQASGMPFKFQAVSGFPSEEAGIDLGVSAAFAGFLNGQVVLAGGCNFPDVPAVDGGAKKFYQGIYIAPQHGSVLKWKKVGELPAPAAYGVTVQYENSLILAGGNNASGGLTSVCQIKISENQTVGIKSLPSLPQEIDNMSGAVLNHHLYIFGGKMGGKPSRKLISLDLKNPASGWKNVGEIPGSPRLQSVMVAARDGLYIWGGFTSAFEGNKPEVCTDGYKFQIKTGKWTRLESPVDKSGKKISLGGGVGVNWRDSLLIFTGGVNQEIFLSALRREATLKGDEAKAKARDYLSRPVDWYQFNDHLLAYHLPSGKWQILSKSKRFARAGASLISDENGLMLIGGETKPGIRSTDISRINKIQSDDFTAWVNPFIGTGGHGHTFPGPVAPYGMIQPGPDTRIFGWDACSGYYYDDNTINGFSHTHLSGTGCGDYGDFLLMPTVGKQNWKITDPASQTLTYASHFSHVNEKASPGYYSVYLDDYQVKAELTATPRAAMHRYTFPASGESGFILDLDYSLQGQKNNRMEVEVIGDTIIKAYKNTTGWAWDHQLCFYAVFSKPFQYTLKEDTLILGASGQKALQKKVLLKFQTIENELVMVKMAISSVDVNGAAKNLQSEIPDWNFDRVVAQTRASWNNHLGRIKIKTTDQEQKTIFYTSLYHTGISPSMYSDVDGRYRGMDKKIYQTEKNHYTIFSLWDTFRAFHPLMTIINPQKNDEFIESLMGKYREGGIFPMWELASNYTGTMIGYHAIPVVVDAWMKGNRDVVEGKELLKACLRSAEYDTTGILSTRYVRENALMPKSKWYKNTLGFIPCDSENESVAKALEYAYNDWCIARLAESLNENNIRDRYDSLALNYKHYYDAQTGFMRGKYADGSWRTPFSPNVSTHRNDDYCEGTAWQWTWFVPHDVDGLKKLMGGETEFLRKLNLLFSDNTPMEGDAISADISGMIGQFAHGNEPSHHIIHLYNYTSEPWKTQLYADSVLYHQYRNAPDGLSGNEDCGQMSAWYILNAMGFYQIAPGNPVYSIGRPMFDQIEIPLANGKVFNIKVHNNSQENKFIRSVKLNGKKLKTPFFTHQDILNGGVLEFEMTDEIIIN